MKIKTTIKNKIKMRNRNKKQIVREIVFKPNKIILVMNMSPSSVKRVPWVKL